MMSVWDWVLLAACLGIAIYWYMTRYHDYWKSVGVPTLTGVLPGLGHMWDIVTFKESLQWWVCNVYRETKGPAVGIYVFREPALVVRDLDLVQDVLVKDFSSFHDNFVTIDESVDPHFSKNPFMLTGERWKTMRQKLNPALSPAKVKAMFPLVERVCHEFNKYIVKHINEDIDLGHVTGLFTSEVVAKCAFGLDGGAFSSDCGEFYRQGQKMFNASVYNPFLLFLLQFFPSLNKILGQSFVPKELTNFFTCLVKQTEEYRMKNPENVPDDYFQFLLGLKNKDSNFTIDDVVAQSLTFFTDGFETTSVTARFVIYELTVNPEIQEALRHEVEGMETFSYDNIMSLGLLDRVCKETLRKYSTFALAKNCTQNQTLQANGSSYPVRKGLQVIIPTYAIHHDPEIYPDPQKFDPDRFLPELVKQRHAMSFLAFGGGPRMCIGNRFATSTLKVFIAYIIAHFRLAKCSKTVDQIKLVPQHILPVAEGGVWCKFTSLSQTN